MAPTLFRNLFVKNPQQTDTEKLLAGTKSSRSSEILVTQGSQNDASKESSSANERSHERKDVKASCVQICCHEKLSFERMKRITRLPDFKYSGDKIDAFTKAPSPYHVLSAAGTHRCRPHPNDFSSLEAKSFYKYQSCYEGQYDGLTLCVHWTMNFDDHMAIAGSVSDLQRFLGTLDIRLCEHAKMSDLRIAGKLYRFCNPNGPVQDPVDVYEKLHRGRVIDKCKECHTVFDTYKEGRLSHVVVKRYLGSGSSAYEQRWLAQCGEEGHRLRSFGVAVFQTLKSYI